jgi:hypothetical protein
MLFYIFLLTLPYISCIMDRHSYNHGEIPPISCDNFPVLPCLSKPIAEFKVGGTGTGTGTGTGIGTGTAPGTAPGTSPVTGTGANTVYVNDTNTGAGAGTSAGPGTWTGTGIMSDPGTDADLVLILALILALKKLESRRMSLPRGETREHFTPDGPYW